MELGSGNGMPEPRIVCGLCHMRFQSRRKLGRSQPANHDYGRHNLVSLQVLFFSFLCLSFFLLFSLFFFYIVWSWVQVNTL